MKRSLLAVITVLLTSCAEHQYLTLSGINIDKNDRHEFVSQNDTLKLVYHFKPGNGEILVSVLNRTAEPLVVDWWKSAITVDNRVFSFYNPNARLNGEIDADTSLLRSAASGGSSVYFADVTGTVHINQTSQFIPPHGQISNELVVLSLDTLKNLPEQEAKKDTIRISYDVFLRYRTMSFEKEKSPLGFKSYMTFRIGKGKEESEFVLEHKFYVSEVWKIRSGLREIPERITSRGDMIYLAR